MRFNESALRQMAKTLKADREGRLSYRAPKESYKERWFKVKGNLLFFYKTNDLGALSDPDPLGMLILDRCKIQMEPIADRPFVFSVLFDGEGDRKHYFSGQSIQQCQEWVAVLQASSIETLRARLQELSSKVQRHRGGDPLADIIKMPKRNSKSRTVSIATGTTTNRRQSRPSSSFTAQSTASLDSKQIDFIPCAAVAEPKVTAPTRNSMPIMAGQSTFQPLIPSHVTQKQQQQQPFAMRSQQGAFSIDRQGTKPKTVSLNLMDAPIVQTGTTTSGWGDTSSQQEVLLSPSKLQGWEIFD